MSNRQDVVHDLARRLLEAGDSSTSIDPIGDAIGATDVDTAYAVQQACVQTWLNRGRVIVGRKIGLTNPLVQRQLGVDRPDYGVLFGDMEYSSGSLVPFSCVLQPRIEAEMAFVLSSDLPSADVTSHDVAAAIGHVVAALEIVGSRITAWRIGIVDTIADNASSGAFVVGDNAVPLSAVDLTGAAMRMVRTTSDGSVEIVSSGVGADCLGSPLLAATWLAAEMVRRGAPLLAGDIVLTGALGPMVAVAPGDSFVATVSGLGDVAVQFGDVDPA